MTNHPITPPQELVQEWFDKSPLDRGLTLATKSAQWGADQELEATLGLMETLNIRGVDYIRNARRPQPPSLKEQALALLDKAEDPSWDINDFSIVRKALESL